MSNSSSGKLFSILALFVSLFSITGCDDTSHDNPGVSAPNQSSSKNQDTSKPPAKPPKSERNAAGVFLGRNYKYSHERYVFSDSSADMYEQLENTETEEQWVFKVNDNDRLVTVSHNTGKTDKVKLNDKDASLLSLQPISSEPDGWKTFKRSDIEAIAVAKPGDWYLMLKNAPVTVLEHSVRVDFSMCQTGTACADSGGNSDSQVLNVESDGQILSDANHQAAKYNLED